MGGKNIFIGLHAPQLRYGFFGDRYSKPRIWSIYAFKFDDYSVKDRRFIAVKLQIGFKSCGNCRYANKAVALFRYRSPRRS